MKNWVEKQFKLAENHTNIRTEIVAGIATFVTMAYVLATVPNILGGAGFDKGGILTAMIILIMVTTVAMSLYTNYPFALAPGLGSVSIVAGMVANEGISIPIASGIIFLSGVFFILISFLGLRAAVVRVIPKSLKFAVSAGIGLFIALIGAKSSGLVVANEGKNALGFGNLTSPTVILTVIGFVIILILKTRRVPGYIIVSILITTLIGIPMGLTKLPDQLFSVPSGVENVAFQIDILGALNFAYIPFLIALFVPDFFSTFGTVLGVGAKAGYLDKDGNLPGIDKCFKIDALATSLGGMFCIPCLTTYLESSVGVESGGRTGLTTVVTSIVFGLTLFLAPIALMIPAAATAPALIFIGIGMLGSMKNIDYTDETEYIPAFICVTFTIFANNIANGICVALPVYLLLKLVTGKRKELSLPLYIIVGVCILYFCSIV